LQLSGYVKLVAEHVLESNARRSKIDGQKSHDSAQNMVGVDRHGGKQVTTTQSVSQQRHEQPTEGV
jgi:hypothetical protein